MQSNGVYFMPWKKIPRQICVWKRKIRPCRKISELLLKIHVTHLNNESLCTILVEVEAIVNSLLSLTDLLITALLHLV